MTYLGFLTIFLAIPLLIVGWLTWRDHHSRRPLPASLGTFSARWVILAHVLVAILYTTPWDNYLVATNVWGYPPNRVLGLTLGWVPIEEYIFFVLQSLLAGMWWMWLARRLPVDTRPLPHAGRVRWMTTIILGVAWLAMAALFFMGGSQFTYVGLILLWAIPPIMLQTSVGADVLWRCRRLLVASIISLTVYLSAADFLAIGNGIWTIDPAQSLQIYLGGVLPLEEFVFFLVTNTLLAFGLSLVLSVFTQQRVRSWLVKSHRANPISSPTPLPDQMAN
jgi:lycopene cyclase domain-containing protein